MSPKRQVAMRIKKTWIITPIVAAVLAVGAIASASILATDGTAKVTGNVGTLTAVTNVDGANHFDGALWPGHSVGCTVVVHNPNSVDVKINSLHAVGILVASPAGALVFQGDPSVAAGWAEFPDITPVNFVVGAGQDGSYHTAGPCATVDNNDDTAYAGDSVAVHYSVAFQSN